MDIGSGGGFPAIPIAIARPDIKVMLIERNQKKCRFLEQAVMHLPLQNVSVVQSDIRDFVTSLRFDTITARAVADPATLWQWSPIFLNRNGQLLLQTTEPICDELPQTTIQCSKKVQRGWVTAVTRAQ